MQRIASSRSPRFCYLCGLPLGKKRDCDDDHVPPKQFYAKVIRRQLQNLNLCTLPTHRACNQSFQKDEDYFVNTLLPLVLDSPSGWAIGQDLAAKAKNGKQLPLINKVLNEFEDRPSGLILPGGLIVKRLEGERIVRIAWKIVRGLYFHHEGKILSEATVYKFLKMILPGERLDEVLLPLSFLATEPGLGKYPEIFNYKYIRLPKIKWSNIWALLLWDRITMVIVFQNPAKDSGPHHCMYSSSH